MRKEDAKNEDNEGPAKKNEVLEIREKFMAIDTRPLDSKNRITLGGET